MSKTSAYTLIILVALALVVFLYLIPPTDWDRARAFGDQLQRYGTVGMVGLFIIGALGTAIGLPRQVVAFTGGYAYGTPIGLVIALLASLMGCTLTLLASRFALRGWVSKRYPQPVATLERLLANDVVLKIIALRLQPLGTNLLTNLCAGVCAIPIRRFLLGTAVGYIPQALVFALLGAGVRVGSGERLIVSGVLLLVSVVLGWVLYRRHVVRKIDTSSNA